MSPEKHPSHRGCHSGFSYSSSVGGDEYGHPHGTAAGKALARAEAAQCFLSPFLNSSGDLFKKKKKKAASSNEKGAVCICSEEMGLSLLALLVKDPAGMVVGEILT